MKNSINPQEWRFYWLKAKKRASEKFRRLKRSDQKEAIRQFDKRFGFPPNLKTPKTFSEKVTYLKLNADKPVFRELADKLRVRDYVADRIGADRLIPLLANQPVLTRHLFDTLPAQFVIKANHGSAMNRIVFDKQALDYEALKKETDTWVACNFYTSSRETQYRHIDPTILVERLMLDEDGNVPRDYKIHCFRKNGAQKMVLQVDSDRLGDHTRDFYTSDWERVPLRAKYPTSPNTQEPTPPACLQELLECADQLSEGFSYVRVDLYVINNHVYFGEMTFTPGSGFIRFDPEAVDEDWGRWFDLPYQLSLRDKNDLHDPAA
ncbi:ATP-grasp fold amidoligase family protein [Chromohalobacter nigrandesensis]|uniref:ATP-grasp fold amidoligase family protein n=1 Tax=Chromohalobacter nigrandesensis TaxID=119863 RepID=UPI001FF4DEFB|nr:ATP-grasp fold amidoligase family protein [Chromohalobacter nigrandesensis]MCK0744801.1 hypothetical protein [Chromohalobacter nigrandesensis]